MSFATCLYPKALPSVSSQSLAVSSTTATPTGYTLFPAPGGAQSVFFDVQISDVMCRWDATTPTGTSGHLFKANAQYRMDAAKFNASKFIRVTSATVDAVVFSSPELTGY